MALELDPPARKSCLDFMRCGQTFVRREGAVEAREKPRVPKASVRFAELGKFRSIIAR